MKQLKVQVTGAGILGLWQTYMLLRAGHRVELRDTEPAPFGKNSSRLAGAMIAPECEAEGAPDIVRTLGREGLALWREHYPDTISNGTLVVAMPRDAGEFQRFARMTERHATVRGDELTQLEPALAGRFDQGLYYADEAHVEAPRAMNWLLERIRGLGGEIDFGDNPARTPGDFIVDCRGMGAAEDIPNLRGVRGERLIVETRDITLSRPVRLLHPRQPIYIVPQSPSRFVLGATVVEREDVEPVTVKSALDILGAAYALLPAFGEARIIEMAAGVRPAFADNVPRIMLAGDGRTLRVNGAYRHGYLLAPVLAQAVVDYVSDGRQSLLFHRA